MKLVKAFLQGISLAAACAVLSTTAHAQEEVKLAYLKTLSSIPFYYAQEMGYFKDEGIDLELMLVQTGPAAASAVASGAADLGYAAAQIPIAARAQKLPFKLVVGLEWEQIPGHLVDTLLASKRSGVKSIKDLVGKTILMNAPGGACELRWHEWLTHNGIRWDQVKVLTAPYPQTQAMLELGTADAACGLEPFTTAIKQSRVEPVVIAEGMLVDQSKRYLIDGLFATDTWAQQNGPTIAALKRALAKSSAELKKKPEKVQEILVSEYRLPAEVAKSVEISLEPALDLQASDIQPIVDAMEKYHMLEPGLKVADLIVTTQAK